MSDSILPLFLKKVSEIRKLEDDKLPDALRNLEKWLVGNRSLIQHKCCQAFLTYLWQSHGDDFKSRDGFVSYVKAQIGYCKTKTVKTIDIDSKCPECGCTLKEKAYLKEFMVKSLSFASCVQKVHNQVFERIQEFAMTKWNIDFNLWYQEWLRNEGTLQ